MNILFLFNLATLLLRPTFNSCGVYEDGVKGSTVSWCEIGSDVWSTEENFRGSILNLKEDTAYKIKIERTGMPVMNSEFRTWKSDVPVARTIEIDPSNFEAPFKVDQKGAEDGWIRITAKGGKLHNPTDKPTFEVEGAEFVLLDDMVLTGAEDSRNVIYVKDSKAVRIRNCDISGWGSKDARQCFIGRYGKERYKPGNGKYVRKNGGTVNYEGAIHITRGADMTVVERCYIHDPLTNSVSWYYTHPAGPQAVVADHAGHSTVLRWNDFIGSDEHWWNDAVEGPGNFFEDGSLNRDSDVYGNFMIFANDDCVELDGGQQNVRCYDNRFEGSLTGVSVQGCMVGPSFVYNNLFSGLGEEYGLTNYNVKTSEKNGKGARTYVFNNLFWGNGGGVAGRTTILANVYGNKFYGTQKISTSAKTEAMVIAHDNETGIELEEKNLPATYPVRPLGFVLSGARISVGLDRTPVSVGIIGKLPKGTVICKPFVMDWLKPEIKGSRIIIKFDDSKMHSRREYRGAFIVRTPDGLSRPVSVYAKSDFVPPFKAEKEGDVAIYAENFKLEPKGVTTSTFNVGKEGTYWLLIHGQNAGKRQEVSVKLDGVFLGKNVVQQFDYPTWAMVCPSENCRPIYTMVYHIPLAAGPHTFELKHENGDKPFDGLVLTDNPEAFEPK